MVIVGIPRDRVIEYDMGGEDTEQRRSKIADHIADHIASSMNHPMIEIVLGGSQI
jgi:hypothetical protein